MTGKHSENTPLRIAVAGSGISGNLVARLLSSRHYVTLFEANNYAGGHTNTVDIELAGERYAVDTGFMVFNQKTYPNFCQMLNLLGVTAQNSDMSFSVRCAANNLEYAGSSLNGLFAQRRNLWNYRFYSMLSEILRFNRQSPEVLETGDALTLGEYLDRHQFSKEFRDHYLLPMTGAIWSCQPDKVLEFPARFLVAFFQNHGLLQVFNKPVWQTIAGGARKYVQKLIAPLGDQVRLNSPVRSVVRAADQVLVQTERHGPERFDCIVFATHADQTLEMLRDADPLEQGVLSAFAYQESEAVLHTDTNLLPKSQRAWASWNYHIRAGGECGATVTYDLSRLQQHDSPVPILLTLNSTDMIDPAKVIAGIVYQHPACSHASLRAQEKHQDLNGHRNSYYCGAYWGYGFHEDGVKSALTVAEHFGIGLNACTAASIRGKSPIAAIVR